jgi:hypothetical protein
MSFKSLTSALQYFIEELDGILSNDNFTICDSLFSIAIWREFALHINIEDAMNKAIRVLPHMCAMQRKDIECMLRAADEIGSAAATIVSRGGQGYDMLLEARDRFREQLLEMMDHTRVCIEEDEDTH